MVSKLPPYAVQFKISVFYLELETSLFQELQYFLGICTLLMHVILPKLKSFVVKNKWTRNNILMHLQKHLVVGTYEFWCETNNPRFGYDFL